MNEFELRFETNAEAVNTSLKSIANTLEEINNSINKMSMGAMADTNNKIAASQQKVSNGLGVFTEKTRQGVANLVILLENYPDRNLLIQDIRLLRVYAKIEKWKLIPLFSFAYLMLKKIMLFNFKSKHPNLFLFNLYKLNYLCYLRHNNLQDI